MQLQTIDFLPSKTRIKVTGRLKQNLVGLLQKQKKNFSRYKIWRYKKGISNLTIDDLISLGVDKEDIFKNTEAFGLEASYQLIQLPEKILVDEELAWFLGFHITENSETPWGIGVCNTNTTLIRKAFQILKKKFQIPIEKFRLEIRVTPRMNEREITKDIQKYLGLSRQQIRISKRKEVMNYPLFTLRINSSLIKSLVKNIEVFFIGNALKFRRRTQAKFIQGVFDADAWINKTKGIIVLTQRKEKLVLLIEKLLLSLNIKCRKEYWKKKHFYACIITKGRNKDNLLSFRKKIGFSHPIKNKQLSQYLSGASLRRS